MRILDFIMDKIYFSIVLIGIVGFVYLFGLFMIWLSEVLR